MSAGKVKKIRIGIDGKALAIPFPCGTKHYARELIYSLAEVDKKNDYYIFTPRKVPIPSQKNFHLRVSPGLLPVFKTQIWLPWAVQKEQIDVFHYLQPFGSLLFDHPRIVTTVHDLDLDKVYPKFRSIKYFIKRYYSGFLRFYTLKNTKRFIAVSNTTLNDLEKYMTKQNKNIDAEVIYEGVRKPRYSRLRQKRNKYFLCMGDFSPRKNVRRIIRAFDFLPPDIKDKYHLIIVASTEEAAHSFKKYKVKHINIIVKVSATKLISLYQNATAFIFPSLYEGFGLPILEAMVNECPVIASDLGSMREVAGNAALPVNPVSEKSISLAMEKIALSAGLRKKLIKKGLSRVKMFSWRKTAENTLAVYKQL